MGRPLLNRLKRTSGRFPRKERNNILIGVVPGKEVQTYKTHHNLQAAGQKPVQKNFEMQALTMMFCHLLQQVQHMIIPSSGSPKMGMALVLLSPIL